MNKRVMEKTIWEILRYCDNPLTLSKIAKQAERKAFRIFAAGFYEEVKQEALRRFLMEEDYGPVRHPFTASLRHGPLGGKYVTIKSGETTLVEYRIRDYANGRLTRVG